MSLNNERLVSVYLAFFLLALGAATLWNGHQLAAVADLKLDSPLSDFALRNTTGAAPMRGALVILPLVVALALGKIGARWLGLGVVIGLGALNWGLLLPYLALVRELTGEAAQDASSAVFSSPLISPAALVMVGNGVVAVAFALASLRVWRVVR